MREQPNFKIQSFNKDYLPNLWDIIALVIILGIVSAIAWAATQMSTPYSLGKKINISLDPSVLPMYSLQTVLRMFIAMVFSLLVTLSLAPLAAKNKTAENFIIPFIDIMQSIPVLGMLSITVVGFIKLFPGSILGPECAAIFAIFTSQVWNMVLSLYQSLKTVPQELKEVAKIYQLSRWQSFWKIEVPHGAQGLLWNTMVSMSAGWFFVVLSEAIEVANQSITLPGLGSYIHTAILASDLGALGYAIIAMFIVILLYDQLIFRPLLSWAEKFNAEISEESLLHSSWFFDLLTKTKLLRYLDNMLSVALDRFVNLSRKPLSNTPKLDKFSKYLTHYHVLNKAWYALLVIAFMFGVTYLYELIHKIATFEEIIYVSLLGLITAIKVLLLIILASIIWVPIGVWIGLRPRIVLIVQPLIQFAAAFPANLFYPIFVMAIIKYDLNKHIWTMPLMILGTQWYILFNVIGGAASIPKEIKLATKNLGVKGWLWWRKFMLPAIFPYYTTGAMAAAGGCWNASIVAEYVEWGNHKIISTGLGQYITEHTHKGDFAHIALGISIMCIYVILFNRIIWQNLYKLSADRYKMD